jgi:spore maturation protein CgeB
MKIFVFGSSIVSSYWNGAATYYRGIYKYLARLGHEITFAEPDAYQRQQHRDEGDYSYARPLVYRPGVDLDRMLEMASGADVVIKHSGIGVDDDELETRILECQPHSRVCFWDVDAPATIDRMHRRPEDPFCKAVPQYDAVLTYGGGPMVQEHYASFGAQRYCSVFNAVDPDTHFPVEPQRELECDLAFVGNRLPDRESRVEELFLCAAAMAPEMKFILGGEGWGGKPLPANVRWIGHVPTGDHNRINCSARMVLNINRASMASFGFSPPTRVFEVAGSGACLLCDEWPGIEEFFVPEKEILIIRSGEEVVSRLRKMDATLATRTGVAFRTRALRDHSYSQRALQVQEFLASLLCGDGIGPEADVVQESAA